VALPRADRAFDDAGNLSDVAMAERVEDLVVRVLATAAKLAA
jgi:hypothetical protein